MAELKQPNASLIFTYDFTAMLAGADISSITSVTQAARGGGAALTEVSRSNNTKQVSVKWSGGANNETYRTTVIVLDSVGQTQELDGEIVVLDLTFALPTGITSTYLTGEEYVARYGIDETVQLTSAYGSETVGESLGKALSDAAARIEGYIAGRYALPLVVIPPILKVIASDLARERLFTNHPTDEVTRRADQARKDLQDIAKGTLALLAGTVLVEDSTADSPAYYTPDQIFTDAALSSYRGRMQ